MKVTPSKIPGKDSHLKRIAERYGGWSTIMTVDFAPSLELYHELEAADFPRENFDRARVFLKDPKAYAKAIGVLETKKSLEKFPKLKEVLDAEKDK